MAKKRIDPNNLTIDFRQLMSLTIQDRIDFFKNGGANYFESLTPTQLSQLFPRYYQQNLPDIGKAVSGGTRGTVAPSTGRSSFELPSTGRTGGGGAASTGPSTSSPAATPLPSQSKVAQQNAFLEHLEKMTGRKSAGEQSQVQEQGKLGVSGTRQIVKAHEAGKGFTKVEYNDGTVEIRKGDFGWRNNNPGNIEAGEFASKYGAIPGGGRYALFPTMEAGNKAREALLFEGSKYKNLSLREAIKRWAPPGPPDFNDSEGYAKKIAEAAGVSMTTKMSEFTPQQREAAMKSQALSEGIKTGSIETVRGPTQTEKVTVPETSVPTSQFDNKLERDRYYSSLYQRGAEIGGVKSDFNEFRGQCGKGTRGMAGALLGDSYFSKGLGSSGSENAGSLAINNNYLQKSGFYNERQSVDPEKLKSKEYLDSLPIGTVIASHNNGNGPGHVQIKVDSGQWVSDKKQGNTVLFKGSGGAFTGFAVITPNQAGLQKLNPNISRDPATVAWAQQQGYNLSEQQQKVLSANPSIMKEVAVKPQDYDSWDPKLKEYIEKLPESVQKKFYEQANILKEKNGDINTAFKNWENLKGNSTEAAKGVVSTVTSTPASQIVKYGVGIVDGQTIDPKELIQRETNAKGRVTFGVQGMEHISFTAASGGNRESLPQGTYAISGQRVGSTISGYYEKYGLTTQGNFGKVFNVQQPRKSAVAGYDPKAGYTRTEIQFHAFPIKSQLDRMRSSGCIVMPPDQYNDFVTAMEQAEQVAGKGNIALRVTRNKDGSWDYKVIQATQAQDAITPQQAMNNQRESGSIAGPTQISQSRFFMSQSGYTNTQLEDIAKKNPGSTIMIDPNWDENKQKQMRSAMERLGLHEQTYYEGRGGPTGSKWDPEEYKRIDRQRQDYNKRMGTNFDMTDWRENGKYLLHENERVLQSDKIGKKYEIDNMKYSDVQQHMNWRREHGIKSKFMPKNLSEDEIKKFKQDNPDWKDHVPGYSFHEHGTYKDKKEIEKLWEGQVQPYFDANAAATYNYRTPTEGAPIAQPQAGASAPKPTPAPAPAVAPAPALNIPTPTPAATPLPSEQKAATATPASGEKNNFGSEKSIKENKYGGEYQATSEDMAVVNTKTGQPQFTFNRDEQLSLQDGQLKVTPANRTNPDELQPTNQIAQQQESSSFENAAGMFSNVKPETYSPPTVSAQNNFTDRLQPASLPQNDGITRAMAQSMGFHDPIGSNYGYGTAAAIRNGFDTTVNI